MSVIKTGVFATPEEREECRKMSDDARLAPVAKVHGVWLHEEANALLSSRIDQLAQRHGLPPPGLRDGEVDHYGMTKDGEFIRLAPEESF